MGDSDASAWEDLGRIKPTKLIFWTWCLFRWTFACGKGLSVWLKLTAQASLVHIKRWTEPRWDLLSCWERMVFQNRTGVEVNASLENGQLERE